MSPVADPGELLPEAHEDRASSANSGSRGFKALSPLLRHKASTGTFALVRAFQVKMLILLIMGTHFKTSFFVTW